MVKDLLWTWEENGYTFCLRYDQVDGVLQNFRIFSDGMPFHRLSEYTSIRPLLVDTWEEVQKIVPEGKLNLCLVDEREYEEWERKWKREREAGGFI